MTQPVVSPIEWKEVHTEIKDNVVVTIKKSSHPKPRYSFDVRFFGNRGEPMHWHNPQWKGSGKELEIINIATDAAVAISKATDWIQAAMIQDYWDVRSDIESKRAQWEKNRPKNMGTHQKGKTSG